MAGRASSPRREAWTWLCALNLLSYGNNSTQITFLMILNKSIFPLCLDLTITFLYGKYSISEYLKTTSLFKFPQNRFDKQKEMNITKKSSYYSIKNLQPVIYIGCLKHNLYYVKNLSHNVFKSSHPTHPPPQCPSQ